MTGKKQISYTESKSKQDVIFNDRIFDFYVWMSVNTFSLDPTKARVEPFYARPLFVEGLDRNQLIKYFDKKKKYIDKIWLICGHHKTVIRSSNHFIEPE